jgi:hypothetical protein
LPYLRFVCCLAGEPLWQLGACPTSSLCATSFIRYAKV